MTLKHCRDSCKAESSFRPRPSPRHQSASCPPASPPPAARASWGSVQPSEDCVILTLRLLQVRLKTSQPFHGVIHARDSRDNACLTYGTSRHILTSGFTCLNETLDWGWNVPVHYIKHSRQYISLDSKLRLGDILMMISVPRHGQVHNIPHHQPSDPPRSLIVLWSAL